MSRLPGRTNPKTKPLRSLKQNHAPAGADEGREMLAGFCAVDGGARRGFIIWGNGGVAGWASLGGGGWRGGWDSGPARVTVW